MDRLPDDLVQCIFRKLAVQDPFSLLQASCVCTSLHQPVEKDHSLWNEAFLAPVVGSSDQQSETLLSATDSADLDREVVSLGGYKQLALLRARHMHKRVEEQSRPDHPEQNLLGNWKAASEEMCSNDVARFLDVYRFGRTVIGWSADKPEKTPPLGCSGCLLSSGTSGDSVTIPIDACDYASEARPISTTNWVGVPFDRIVKTWVKRAGIKTSGGNRVVTEKISVETYAFLR